jgi:hypothetical protein
VGSGDTAPRIHGDEWSASQPTPLLSPVPTEQLTGLAHEASLNTVRSPALPVPTRLYGDRRNSLSVLTKRFAKRVRLLDTQVPELCMDATFQITLENCTIIIMGNALNVARASYQRYTPREICVVMVMRWAGHVEE